jgi:fatty acid desaturase
MEVAVSVRYLRTRRRAAAKSAVEWPTLLLILSVHIAWFLVGYWHESLPVVWAPIMAALLVLHSSLQHEIMHGHPTRSRAVNEALASLPLAFWLPYETYRVSHLRHHRDERLTDPLDDPESYYVTPEQWAAMGPAARALAWTRTTLLGRVLLGPAFMLGRHFASEARLVLRGDRAARRIWARHVLHCLPVALWLVLVARIDLWLYAIAVVYPALSVLSIRSFAEHRAAAEVAGRTATVEGSWLLGPLFLFNNLHVAHHARPALAWYRVPGWYRRHRDELVVANAGLVYRDYLDVARRYLLTPHDAPVHPFGRAPS